MAPLKKPKTYGRSNRSLINNSVDAFNVLFAKNMTKRLLTKKKKNVLIKDLPLRRKCESLLGDDSLQISTEDTFDKLLKKPVENHTKIPSLNVCDTETEVVENNASNSSVRVTRQMKRLLLSNSSSSLEKTDSIDKTHWNRLQQPSIDKIEDSLEIERIKKNPNYFLSYITVPKEPNVSNETSNLGISATDFIRNLEQEVITHCSTPIASLKQRKVINQTISPIKVNTLLKQTFQEIHKWDNEFPVEHVSKNICFSSFLNDIRSEPQHSYIFKNVTQESDVEDHLNGKSSKESFITLRKRKVLRSNKKNIARFKKNLTVSLASFSNFEMQNSNLKDSLWSLLNFTPNRKICDEESNKFSSDSEINKDSVVRTPKQSIGESCYDRNINSPSIKELHVNLSNRNICGDDFENFYSSHIDNYTNSEKVSRRSISIMENITRADIFEHFYTRNINTIGSEDDNEEYIKKISLIRAHSEGNLFDKSFKKKHNLMHHQPYCIQEQTTENIGSKKLRAKSMSNRSKGSYSKDDFENFYKSNITTNRGHSSNAQSEDTFERSHGTNLKKSHKIDDDKYLKVSLTNLSKAQPEDTFEKFYKSNLNISQTNDCYTNEEEKIEKIKDLKVSLTNLNLRVDKDTSTEDSCINEEVDIPDRQLIVNLVRNDYGNLMDIEDVIHNVCKIDHFEMFYKDNYGTSKTNDDSSFNDSDVIESSLIESFSMKKRVKKKTNANEDKLDKNSKEVKENSILNSAQILHVTADSVVGNYSQAIKENDNVSPKHSQDVPVENSISQQLNTNNNKKNLKICNKPLSRHRTRSMKVKPKVEYNEIIVLDSSCDSNTSNRKETINNSFFDVDVSYEISKRRSSKKSDVSSTQNLHSHGNSNNHNDSNNDCITIENSSNSNHKKLSSKIFKSPSKDDILTSPVVEMDNGIFKLPNCNSETPKTLLIKAGKSWRRSLSVYRRSSAFPGFPAENSSCSNCRKTCPKGKLTRLTNQRSSNRLSVRFVPIKPLEVLHNDCGNNTVLEEYAANTSYVPDQILEASLEDSFRCLSLNPNQRRTSVKSQLSVPVTAREIVLRTCGQTDPIPFSQCFPGSVLQNCQKIGEGVYGEVFLLKNPNGGTSVLKIIPVEGDQIVNGERQKKFEEVLSEIIITIQLSKLRNNQRNGISSFTEVQKIQCVQGRYPEKLIDLWDLFDETRGSENDCPDIFGDEQLYIVFQMAYGGKDLESFTFNGAMQAYYMFKQVALALAIAEKELKFEHRDLHWGNVLISTVEAKKLVSFNFDNKNYDIPTMGVEIAIIDYTLSRIEHDGVVIYNDLGLDPDLFTAEGDYQFEIYRLMQQKNRNDWREFEPFTNLLWLDYILEKALVGLRYKNTKTKRHKDYLRKLRTLKEDILSYQNVNDFVIANLLDN